MRIGLLGGSFNPAHRGHAHISALARSRLQLDEIWWLVSPQNPLKPVDGMAPLDDRVRSAGQFAGSTVRVCSLEAAIGTQYTAATLRYLETRYRGTRFVWIMGADNLSGLHLWEDWRGLVETFPIAVVDRPGEGLRAVRSRAAIALERRRLDDPLAPRLAMSRPPVWTFVRGPLNPLSSSAIRASQRTGSGSVRAARC